MSTITSDFGLSVMDQLTFRPDAVGFAAHHQRELPIVGEDATDIGGHAQYVDLQKEPEN
jgi:hypothetical protein